MTSDQSVYPVNHPGHRARNTFVLRTYTIVTFDHSHYQLFDYGESDRNSAVGGNVGSIKCETIDASTPVSNDNATPSTMHQSSCPDDSCNSDSDCSKDAESLLYCAK